MPVLNAPGCNASDSCVRATFPQYAASCHCTLTLGGINDLYFIPCSETLSETNLINTSWWSGLVEDEKLGRLGIGLGSISKKGSKTERVGSCRSEQVTQTTWALKYVIKCFDKTSTRTTHSQVDVLIKKANDFLLVARMCDGEEQVLPIGRFSTSDFNWTVPDNSEEYQNIEIELSWQELGLPKTYDVVGLGAIVPKNS